MAHTYNPRTLGGWGRWITWGHELKTSLANMVKPHLYKNTKISRVWQQVPVIPATQEAATGESLEPRSQRLKWAKIVPLHSSLGDWARLYLKKQTNKQKPQWKTALINHSQQFCFFHGNMICNSWIKWIRIWKNFGCERNPALWEAKAGGSPEVWSSRPAWPTWWNPIFTNNTKLTGHGGTCL